MLGPHRAAPNKLLLSCRSKQFSSPTSCEVTAIFAY